MEWRWDFTIEILPRMLSAMLNTLLAAGIGYTIALVVGLIFLLGQRTKFRLCNWIVRECVEFIRSTPLIVQLFFVYFVAPQFGLVLSAWVSAMLTIGLHYGTYLSEVYRGGLEAIPRGQWEACRALNLSPARTYFRVLIPQALPASLPGMGNYLVGIFKDTPMLSTIGVVELMHTANALGAETYRYLEPYTMVGFMFLIISLPTAAWLRKFERYVGRSMGITK
ncbi:ectoine/hydroxyectoine ABC transporter permease subunit EhuD [Pelagibius sp. Alg239-R121]|uniref:ectoine/hydroxyectoine ABC transporter permease subunit EhuD n=1 Tax=Pelagibius sp. Alg239-R121 TaxID=2993448 RepID=UPI0024A77549|nr:ectoine/hydroxyectoine ABC transporter permease subunit EhuD [Pelagibius sp. Alg239-R121]